tara:strand:+ start:1549 stop:1653 length:105 start_codon:yes stop_codon:yes gene_type:complete
MVYVIFLAGMWVGVMAGFILFAVLNTGKIDRLDD